MSQTKIISNREDDPQYSSLPLESRWCEDLDQDLSPSTAMRQEENHWHAELIKARELVDKLRTNPTVPLDGAYKYVIIAQSGITNVPDSFITGDVAVSPIAAAAMTGFALVREASSEFSTSAQIAGKAYAADDAEPIPALLTKAVRDMQTAYTDTAGRPNDDRTRIDLGGGRLGGSFGGPRFQLTPGIYTFGSDVSIGSDLHFRGTGVNPGQGDSDIFILQIAGNLVLEQNVRVVLEHGAQANNIFWQTAGHAKIMTGAHMEGILLVKTDTTFFTGSSLTGRILTQTACVLQMVSITEPEVCSGGVLSLAVLAETNAETAFKRAVSYILCAEEETEDAVVCPPDETDCYLC
jgi:hypothetical protein